MNKSDLINYYDLTSYIININDYDYELDYLDIFFNLANGIDLINICRSYTNMGDIFFYTNIFNNDWYD